MTAAVQLTWNFVIPTTPARAASLEDLGGAQLLDDAAYPPIPPEMPYAAQLNQWALQLGGVNRVITALDLEIIFVTGNPTIVNATGMSDQLTTSFVVAGLGSIFTIAHPATGQVIFGWAAGVLPAPRAKPRAWITDPNPYSQPVVVPSPNSIKVYTWDAAGAAVDAPFVVSIY